MKKIFYLIATFAFFTFSSKAQIIEVSGYGGYMLSGTADFYGYVGNQYLSGEVDVADGPVYGATIGYEVEDTGMQIQFIYGYNKVDSRVGFYGGFPNPEAENIELKIEHFQLGAERTLGGNEKVNAYGAASLGVTAYSPQTSGYSQRVMFSGFFSGLGMKVYASERIGLKFQARMFLPMSFSGVGIYCSGGCGGGATFHVPIVHGEFTGGVVFRIEK